MQLLEKFSNTAAGSNFWDFWRPAHFLACSPAPGPPVQNRMGRTTTARASPRRHPPQRMRPAPVGPSPGTPAAPADQRTILGGRIARARGPPVHRLRCVRSGPPRRTELRRTGLPRRTDLRRTGLSHTDLCRNRMRTRTPCGPPSKAQQALEEQPPGSPPPLPGFPARLTLWVSTRALASARFHSSEGEQHARPERHREW